MQRTFRLLLALIVVTAAVAYTSGASLACDSRRMHNPIERNNRLKPEVVPQAADVYYDSSPPLQEKPRSDLPIMLAIGVAGTAIMVLLRRRKASMLVMGASLAGLCAAIGYFWNSL